MGKRYRAKEVITVRKIEFSINKGVDVVKACREAGINNVGGKNCFSVRVLVSDCGK